MMQLQNIVYEMGLDIRNKVIGMKRTLETNKEWGTVTKNLVKDAIDVHIGKLGRESKVDVFVLDMPYTAETGSGRGGGQNLITKRRISSESHEEKIYCLIDEIDGTWNASCGFPFSCSTMIAFTSITAVEPEDLTLSHFTSGFIIPYFGSGMYISEFHRRPPLIRLWDGETLELKMSPVISPSQTRVIIDLFTEEKLKSLALSIPVIGPIIYDWCDFGRFYGAGVEISMLLGYKNIIPGFSAYVAASQKMDNIIPTYALILGCGGVVTDWWGDSIFEKKLLDRVHVVMSANQSLHDNLISHLSKRQHQE